MKIQVGFKVEEEFYQEFSEYTNELGMSPGSVLREMLIAWIKAKQNVDMKLRDEVETHCP